MPGACRLSQVGPVSRARNDLGPVLRLALAARHIAHMRGSGGGDEGERAAGVGPEDLVRARYGECASTAPRPRRLRRGAAWERAFAGAAGRKRGAGRGRAFAAAARGLQYGSFCGAA